MQSSNQLQFPFENYLTHELPNYDQEWNNIIAKIIITVVIFLVVIPIVLKNIFQHPQIDDSTTNKNEFKDKRKTSKSIHETKTEIKTMNPEVPTFILIILNIFFIIIIFFLIAFSPNNITTARHVYQVPLLKLSECQMIIQMGIQAAQRNALRAQNELAFPSFDPDDNQAEDKMEEYQKILQWPKGWKKDRHTSYPTTDLNVAVDFEKEDLEIISALLNARLSPLLEKIYGITKGSIRANDMFIVRYDENGQQSLRPHTDYSHISFNILLNDEFSGGGTRFHNRYDHTYIDAKPKPGDVLINNAMVSHEGLATTKGTRYILVGFMNIDHLNPLTGETTNVPYYSTYLSFPWLTVSLMSTLHDADEFQDRKRGLLSQSQTADFFTKIIDCTSFLGDIFAPHGIIKLIDDKISDEYISALDIFYYKYGDYLDKSIWFKGQLMFVNMSGRVISEGEDRNKMSDIAPEL